MIQKFVEDMLEMIQSDGNGGIQIKNLKLFVLLILFMITVGSIVAGAVTYTVTTKSKVEGHEQRIENCEKDINGLQNDMREDFKDMKSDVREDLRHMEKNIKEYIDNK